MGLLELSLLCLQVKVPTIKKTLYRLRQTQSLEILEEPQEAMCVEFKSCFVSFMQHSRVMSLDSGSKESLTESQMLGLSLKYTQSLKSQHLHWLCSRYR